MSSDNLPIIENNDNNKKLSKRKVKWYKSPKLWRQATMIFFFVFLMRVAWHHQQEGGGPNGVPSIEAYCPFGGLESLYQFITTGGYIRRIEPSTMVLFFAVLLLTLIFSKGFCGWICPFGSLQEWIGMLGKKVLGKRFNPTGAWDRGLRYLKYVILVVIIALTWWSGTLVFRDYDPFLAFYHFGNEFEEKIWAYSFLIAVLIGSFFIERFFCKYACPLGAVLGVLGKVGLVKINRDEEGCKACNVCQKECFAHVDFLSTNNITDPECNHCMDCVVDCPKPNVLTVRTAKWRFSHPVYAAGLVLGLFGMIGISQATNYWRTKPDIVETRNMTGEPEAGMIRGWMSLNVISEEYGIPLDKLYTDSGLPAKVSADTMIKEIHNEYDIDFEADAIRDVVAAFLAGEAPPGLEAIRSERTDDPERAARRAERAKQRAEAGETGGAPGTGRGDPGGGPGAGGEKPEDHEGEPPSVRGNMTINEIVLKTGIPKDYLLKEAGLPEDVPTRQALRDFLHEYNVTPRDLRDVVDKYHAENR